MVADQCEIVEALGVSASSTATDTAAIVSSLGIALETLSFVQLQTLVSSAEATSTATPDAFTLLTSLAVSTSTLSASVAVDKTLAELGSAGSALFVLFENTTISSAAATSYVDGDAPSTLLSMASAASSVEASTSATGLLFTRGAGVSAVTIGLLEYAVATAAAVDTATPTRVATATLTSLSDVVSSAPVTSTVLRMEELLSQLTALSAATLQVERTVYHRSSITATSSVFNRDKYAQAMVMNTETAAVSTYDNFAFNSIAYVGTSGKAYAASDDGLYLLEGPDDVGENIHASIKSGFTDLGEPHTKHAGSMYFGYTSDSPFTATVETYGAGHAPQTYELEQRAANAPRNSRMKLGKGLSSRFWRVTIENKDGSHFELNDASIDVAVSQRRV